MRRRAGLQALSTNTSSSAAYSTLSAAISTNQLENLKAQMDSFRTALREFATKHRQEILKDPIFRMEFQKMCSAIQVDPLSGPLHPQSTFWSSLLPSFSDWTYELAIQVIDISISTRPINGGIIPLSDIVRKICEIRGLSEKNGISESDVERAVKTLGPLGSGFEVVTLGAGGDGKGGNKVIRSVSRELNPDEGSMINFAVSCGGKVKVWDAMKSLNWKEGRVRTVLEEMCVKGDGVCWFDDQSDGGDREYWIPGAMEWES